MFDIRAPKPKKIKSLRSFTGRTSDIQWNKLNPYILGVAHECDLNIWDIRKQNAPLVGLHSTFSVNALDWSSNVEHQVVACSEAYLTLWSFNEPREPMASLPSPLLLPKAKFMPFANCMMSFSSRSDFSLNVWNLDNLTSPLVQTTAHTDHIIDCHWLRLNNDNVLLTLGKDGRLCSIGDVARACAVADRS